MKIRFEESRYSDSEFAYKLRMDDLSRKMSFNSDKIDYNNFRIGFECRLDDRGHRIFKAYEHECDSPFGLLILHNGSLSWMVDPDRRGGGLGAKMLKQFCDMIAKPVFAQIKYENISSQKIAEKAGFTVMDDLEDYQQWIIE